MKEYFKRLAADPKDGCDVAVQLFAIVGTLHVAVIVVYISVRVVVLSLT